MNLKAIAIPALYFKKKYVNNNYNTIINKYNTKILQLFLMKLRILEKLNLFK